MGHIFCRKTSKINYKKPPKADRPKKKTHFHPYLMALYGEVGTSPNSAEHTRFHEMKSL
jgi:hypothetical protein